jgi:hypothetical protein
MLHRLLFFLILYEMGMEPIMPHHGHHPRGHSLHKIQDSAEWEEVI